MYLRGNKRLTFHSPLTTHPATQPPTLPLPDNIFAVLRAMTVRMLLPPPPLGRAPSRIPWKCHSDALPESVTFRLLPLSHSLPQDEEITRPGLDYL